MARKITIKSPATIANLVCGFDILGLALEEPYDLMTLEFSDEPGLKIKHIDEYNLTEKPEDNVAGAALLSLMEAYNKPLGFTLTIDKKIKPGSGLGSSAASAAAAPSTPSEACGLALVCSAGAAATAAATLAVPTSP
jgi:homoserine kinase